MDDLDPITFKKMFRMDRLTFDHILDLISDRISKDVTKASNRSGQPITPKTRLAATLRWLAGASHLDVCFAWVISRTSFYSE